MTLAEFKNKYKNLIKEQEEPREERRIVIDGARGVFHADDNYLKTPFVALYNGECIYYENNF